MTHIAREGICCFSRILRYAIATVVICLTVNARANTLDTAQLKAAIAGKLYEYDLVAQRSDDFRRVPDRWEHALHRPLDPGRNCDMNLSLRFSDSLFPGTSYRIVHWFWDRTWMCRVSGISEPALVDPESSRDTRLLEQGIIGFDSTTNGFVYISGEYFKTDLLSALVSKNASTREMRALLTLIYSNYAPVKLKYTCWQRKIQVRFHSSILGKNCSFAIPLRT